MQQTPKRERTRRLAGFTLVELMVSLLIVGIVMMGWWRIMNATSPYREAQRRAAVEVAAGVLDVVDIEPSVANGPLTLAPDTIGFCESDTGTECHSFPSEWFPSESPIRYTLEVAQGINDTDWKVSKSDGDGGYIQSSLQSRWLTIKLFDSKGSYDEAKPFAVLRQLIYARP